MRLAAGVSETVSDAVRVSVGVDVSLGVDVFVIVKVGANVGAGVGVVPHPGSNPLTRQIDKASFSKWFVFKL